MSEQVIDFRSIWAVLRRRIRTLVVVAMICAIGGAYLGFSHPPAYHSTSLILFPARSADGEASHQIDTQVQIALSDAVLGAAGQAMSPPMSVSDMREQVDAKASTQDILMATGHAQSPGRAKAISRAVASEIVKYLTSSGDSLSRDQRAALAARRATLEKSLADVTNEIKKASARLESESRSSPEGKADAAALSELTAQQANILLRIDQVKDELAKGRSLIAGQPIGDARIIQQASPAERSSPAARVFAFAGVGLLGGAILASLALWFTASRDLRLRSRDQLADSVAVPVIASLHSHATKFAANWTRLLEAYQPSSVDQWNLHQILRRVNSTSGAGDEAADTTSAVLVISLSDDQRALSVGPQLASFAAARGTSTHLVPAQAHDSTQALWAACAQSSQLSDLRKPLVVGDAPLPAQISLTVHIAVLDRKRPTLHFPGGERAVTLLAVSPGSATAEELAKTAVAADEADRPIEGIVVADPDPSDRSSGRLSPKERGKQVVLATRMTDPTTGASAKSSRADRRRQL